MDKPPSYELHEDAVPDRRVEIFAKLRRARRATQEAIHRTSSTDEKLAAVKASREKLIALGWLKEKES